MSDEKLIRTDGERWMFYCPGCKCAHGVNSRWQFNGNMDKPTFHPSVLVRGVEPLTDEQADFVLDGGKFEPKRTVCHSFVRDGQIEFLSDCTHELAGKTVPMEPL